MLRSRGSELAHSKQKTTSICSSFFMAGVSGRTTTLRNVCYNEAMRRNTSGFTIVEILVVISIIGILATISYLSFDRYQADARDSERSAKTTVLAEAFEEYYDINGEYPSCAALTGTATSVTTTVLPTLDFTTLTAPNSASSETNSIKCTDFSGTSSDPDYFAYIGDGSTACSTGQACLEFKLRYKEESTGNIITISSRRSATVATSGIITTTATTDSSTPATRINVSWTAVPNTTSYNLQRATNASFTGATASSFSATTAAATGLTPGTTYYFRVQAVGSTGPGNWSNTAQSTTYHLVTTLAGSGTSGFANGTGSAAQFYFPGGIAVDSSGNVYVADKANYRIRKVTPAGVATTLAGSGVSGFADGTGSAAQLNPFGVDVDSSGTVYVADSENHRIRKITPAGVVTTLAGSGVAGFVNGTGSAAQFKNPFNVAVDSSGNVYVADSNNFSIRKITPAGVVTTLAGSGTYGYADGTGTAAQFGNVQGIAVDSSGTVYVGDTDNNRVRKITPAGVVTTLAGAGPGYADGTGSAALFNGPYGVDVDSSGNVYVADFYNHRIRKITPAGVVTTLAGSGVAGFADGLVAVSRFHYPYDVAVDSSGDVYVGGNWDHRIRKIE